MSTPKSEPSVGTWRPHRPKGPIAALYGSPGPKYVLPPLTGPKYVLPPLTGHLKHDPTKHTAPAYSFGRRHALSKSDCSPGPKYLIPSNNNITRFGRDGTPAFSLGSPPRSLCRSRPLGQVTLTRAQAPSFPASQLPARAQAPSFSFGIHHSE